MAALEDALWWYRGLRGLVIALLVKQRLAEPVRLLDAGCGTGGMLRRIAARFPGAELHGVDVAESAVEFARHGTGAAIRQGSVTALPYGDATFDVIVSLDVLGAAAVEPARAMAEFRRCLKPGGLLLLNLAAYPWLLSYHDRAVGQSRRFTRASVMQLLGSSGFRCLQGSYWNTLLFPIMVLRRKVWAGSTDGESDVQALPAPLNAAFTACVRLEQGLVGAGLSLPFGGSVIAVAVRE
jgi:SAM-dependent methyltransferase